MARMHDPQCRDHWGTGVTYPRTTALAAARLVDLYAGAGFASRAATCGMTVGEQASSSRFWDQVQPSVSAAVYVYGIRNAARIKRKDSGLSQSRAP
jgi:hypothetical protein